jgi:hypothetical protein
VQLNQRRSGLLAVLREDCQEGLVFEKLRDAINAVLEAHHFLVTHRTTHQH